MSKKTLSKCPLCGNEVYITEQRLSRASVTGCNRISMTLRCRCGIQFTKEWYDKIPLGAVVCDNRDIYDAWNDRYKEDPDE